MVQQWALNWSVEQLWHTDEGKRIGLSYFHERGFSDATIKAFQLGYVPEFGKAMAALKKGEMTDAPVKSQFGFHIIRLDDTREAQFPAFNDVKDQIKQRLEQTKLQDFQEKLRKSAKTDYKFSQ